MTDYIAGLLTGLGLIVAIGAQNVFVLRQGIRREHVLLVVAICAVSDAVLIAAGVAGLGALVAQAPWLSAAARWAGAAFLLVYGLLAARRALTPQHEVFDAASDDATAARPVRAGALGVALACLAFTWLNPHVYLDTVVLLGAIAATKALPWVFAAGAATASVLWFSSLGYGATRLAPVLATPRAWRVLDGLVALTMFVLAVLLAVSAS